jgi:hypothetical protein
MNDMSPHAFERPTAEHITRVKGNDPSHVLIKRGGQINAVTEPQMGRLGSALANIRQFVTDIMDERRMAKYHAGDKSDIPRCIRNQPDPRVSSITTSMPHASELVLHQSHEIGVLRLEAPPIPKLLEAPKPLPAPAPAASGRTAKIAAMHALEHADPYAVLGVKPSASPDQVLAAYKKMMKALDNNPLTSAGAEAKRTQLTVAYERLHPQLVTAKKATAASLPELLLTHEMEAPALAEPAAKAARYRASSAAAHTIGDHAAGWSSGGKLLAGAAVVAAAVVGYLATRPKAPAPEQNWVDATQAQAANTVER